MKLTDTQSEVIILTMELDLKAQEYKMLCDELENLQNNKTEINENQLLKLKQKFLQNQNDIKNINEKLKDLQNKWY